MVRYHRKFDRQILRLTKSTMYWYSHLSPLAYHKDIKQCLQKSPIHSRNIQVQSRDADKARSCRRNVILQQYLLQSTYK